MMILSHRVASKPTAGSLAVLCTLALSSFVEAQQPRFEFRAVVPDRAGGPAGEVLTFPARVELLSFGADPDAVGARGWSTSGAAEAGGRCGAATTDDTVADLVSEGGLRDQGFAFTELTSGAGNEGAVSAVILSNTLPITLSPSGAATILNLTVEGRAPTSGCGTCSVLFPAPLSGSGEPVSNIVTWSSQSIAPTLTPGRVEICGVCFEDKPDFDAWRSINVGDTFTGAARQVTGQNNGACVEICSVGSGYGERDEFQAVSRPVRASADLRFGSMVTLGEGVGEAGISLRSSSRLSDAAYVAIALRRDANGSTSVTTRNKGLRRGGRGMEETSLKVEGVRTLWLQLERVGDEIVTYFGPSPDEVRRQFSVDVSGSSLASGFQELLLYSANGGGRDGVDGQGGTGRAMSALFCENLFDVRERLVPPTITRVVPNIIPLAGGVEVTVVGENFFDATKTGDVQVRFGDVEVQVLSLTDTAIVVEAPSAPDGAPTQVDVVVSTASGFAVEQDGILYVGRAVARGNCNCDDSYDISDALAKLSFLFLGGPPCCCDHAADTNSDTNVDISDPAMDLAFLFLGGPPPPSPFPSAGIPEGPAEPCDAPTGPEVLSVSQQTLGEGDLVEIIGRGFSPDAQRNVVLFGNDVRGEVLEATATRLLVSVGVVPQASRVPVSVLDLIFKNVASCQLNQCRSFVTAFGLASAVEVNLTPSPVTLIASSRSPEPGVINLRFDREVLAQVDDLQQIDISGSLFSRPVSGRTAGTRNFHIEWQSWNALKNFDNLVDGVADRLMRDLDLDVESSAGRSGGMNIRSFPEEGLIQLRATPEVVLAADGLIGGLSILGSWQNCECDGFDPDDDEREFGWCRFTDLISSCAGIPKFMYFFPKDETMQQAGATFPRPHPLSISPNDKSVMYNHAAYCHVRRHNLWNPCKIQALASDGHEEIPEFPCKSIVVKTLWRTAAQLPPSPDPDTLYYHYDHGGTRHYLTLLHFTDKSRADWHWADLYVDTSIGGIGGCGGGQSGMPVGAPWTGVWQNYSMCTNIQDTVPGGSDCGNLEIPIECAQTCQGCHRGAQSFGVSKDFLFSVGTGPNVPGTPCN